MKYPVSRKNNGAGLLRSLLLFKLLELVVVILVLSVLYHTLIGRVTEYRADYESAEVNWTIAAINSAMHTQITMGEVYRALGKPVVRRADVSKRNPISYLAIAPRNYIGELCDPDPRKLPSGNWYFDRCNSRLIYIFTSEKFFAAEHPKTIKFHVESSRIVTDPV